MSALWLKYTLLAEKHTRTLPRVFVEYANLLENWRREIKRISAALAINLNTGDEGAIDDFLTPDLRRQRLRGPVTKLFSTDWNSTVYEALRAAARDEPWDGSAFDRVFEAYRASEHYFRTTFEDYRDLDHTNAQKPVFGLAQSYFDAGDFVNARKWYARRAEMGGAAEEVYFAMYRVAESMAHLGEPWPDVQDAFLRAWEFRPTRAEPLYTIAVHYRVERQYQLGYLFAERAAQIPLPEEDRLFGYADVYAWRAIDEQAVCASWIGKHAEAFTLCRRLLARPDLPDERRRGIAHNRDVSVPAMIEAASSYPDALVGSLVAGPRDAEVTVSLVAGPDRETTEQTLNSFLHCCTDLSRVGRFVVVDAGLSAPDRAVLRKRYGFLEFADRRSGDGPGAQLAQLRKQIGGRFWLHLGQGWRFFAPENYITRLSAVLDAEPQVFQVGINYGDAAKLTSTCAAEQEVRRAPDAGRYVLTDEVASGPAMFDTARLDQTSPPGIRTGRRGGRKGAGGLKDTDSDPIAELGRRATAAGLSTASLDEVLCITAI